MVVNYSSRDLGWGGGRGGLCEGEKFPSRMLLLPKSRLNFTAFPLKDGVAPHFTSRVAFYPQWIDQFCTWDVSLAKGYIPYTKWIYPSGIEHHPRGEVQCNPIL